MNKTRALQIMAVAGAAAFSIMMLSSPSDPLPIPEPGELSAGEDAAASGGPSISILATNLERPRAVAVHENKIFIAEQGGAIRVVADDALLERPLAVFRVADDAYDAGLLGMAIHPDFDENNYLYVFLTYHADDPSDMASGHNTYNKIVRITESDNRLADAAVMLDDIPASRFTNGGFLEFGPDGMLYAGTGTVSEASLLPRDPGSLAGKILRIADDGSIPADNPFGPDSAVYALGYRNPQGMAWGADGTMYAAERGPEKNDEINRVIPGAAYGWPAYECSKGHDAGGAAPNTGPLVLCYDPSIGPGGIAHYSHERLGIVHPFVMASLDASNLYEIDFAEGLSSQKPVLSGVGRIRDVAVHPADGTIYVITSNTDGKGFAGPDDDRLIRITR